MKLDTRMKFRPQSLTYLFLTAFFVVGGFYIYFVNNVSNKGTKLNNLYQDNQQLSQENERLATEAARLASLAVIDQGETGQVQTGDQASQQAANPGLQSTNSTPTTVKPGTSTATPANGIQTQTLTDNIVPVKPKLVLTQKQTYLPTYGQLAKR